MSDDVVSRELLERFLAYISDNSTSGDTSLGLELEFYERNDFDPSIANELYGHFGHWVNGFESPLAIKRPDGSYDSGGRDVAYVRAIAIQLRNYFREKFGKPPLSEEEVACFSIGAPNLPHFENRPNGDSRKVYHANDAEISAAVEYIHHQYGEIIPYIRGIEHLAPLQGYSYRDVFGLGVPLTYINEAFFATLPSIKEYGSYTGWIEARKILSKSTGF